jgi:GNAT superfamily N-acetyltransferase
MTRTRRAALRINRREWPLLFVRDVELTPLTPGDVTTVETVFAGLSARSRQRRFFAAMPRIPGSTLRRLADVDHAQHGCWVAWVDGEPVGLARYVRLSDPQLAEVALEVVDRYQGRGIGRVLAEVAAAAAARVGVRELVWEMLPGNAPVLSLARHSWTHVHVADDIVHARTPATAERIPVSAIGPLVRRVLQAAPAPLAA